MKEVWVDSVDHSDQLKSKSLDRALLLSLKVDPPFYSNENSEATEGVNEREEAEDREHFSKILMNQLNLGSGCRASDHCPQYVNNDFHSCARLSLSGQSQKERRKSKGISRNKLQNER